MAVGLAPGTAQLILNAMDAGTSFQLAASWVKLHVGDPGAAGAANAAVETTRKQASFAAASGGSMASDTALTWTSVGGTEDFTHFSMWSASTAGTFQYSGLITANAVTIGDDFTVNIGGLTLSYAVAS